MATEWLECRCKLIFIFCLTWVIDMRAVRRSDSGITKTRRFYNLNDARCDVFIDLEGYLDNFMSHLVILCASEWNLWFRGVMK